MLPALRPWLRFLLLGGGFWILQQWIWPPPLPLLAPLTQAEEQALLDNWGRLQSGAPSEAQRQSLRDAAMADKLLFSEALRLELHRSDPAIRDRLRRNLAFLGLPAADESDSVEQAIELGLHLGDEVVRQRLLLVMEMLLLERYPPAPLRAGQCRAAFEAAPQRWTIAPTVSFVQLFLLADGDRANTAPLPAAQDLPAQPSEAQLRKLSRPFLQGYVFSAKSESEIEAIFGSSFARQLFAIEAIDHWILPVQSAFGAHAVYLQSRTASSLPPFEVVRDRVCAEVVREQRDAALEEALRILRRGYRTPT